MRPPPTPLRTIIATAPSGGEIRFLKWSDGGAAAELSFYRGKLTAAEDAIWWKSKLAAEKPGIENWEKAIQILKTNGWIISSSLIENSGGTP